MEEQILNYIDSYVRGLQWNQQKIIVTIVIKHIAVMVIYYIASENF